MPFQPINHGRDLQVGPYGGFDSSAELIDPYWIQVSDDGKYLVAHLHNNSEIRIFEAKNGVWERENSIAANSDQYAATADFQHGTHTFVYNDGSNIAEFNIDTNTKTTLFTAPNGNSTGVTYKDGSQDELNICQKGGIQASLRNKNGSIIEATEISDGDQRWRSGTVVHFDGNVIGAVSDEADTGEEGDTVSRVAKVDRGYKPTEGDTGGIQAQITNWDNAMHTAMRGPYITLGNELDNALIIESSGAMRTPFPERSNMVTIRHPPDRDGYEFTGTYNYSTWRYREQGLMDGLHSNFRIQKDTSIADGRRMRRKTFLRPGEEVTVSTTTSASGSNIKHRIITEKPYMLIDRYPTVFERPNVEPIVIEERSESTSEVFRNVGGFTSIKAEIVNDSGAAVDGEIIIERGNGIN